MISYSQRLHWSIPLAVALLALAPRVGPALRAYNPSNDAAEHLLLARSLATKRGFTLPIKVRYTIPGPAIHNAYAERAPLYPQLLALPARFDAAPGWPNPRLQLLNVLLAALAAALAALLTADLARRQGMRGRTLAWTAFLGGVAVAWLPSLVRASIHLWAEPLGLVIALASLRVYLGLAESESDPSSDFDPEFDPTWPKILALGLLVGLARFARPEAWILVPLFLLLLYQKRGLRLAVQLALVVAAVNAVGIAVTGVLAPQLSLLGVASYADLMAPNPPVQPLSGAVVPLRIAGNVYYQLEFMALPKNAFVVLPLALFAIRRQPARAFLLTALALFAATAVVWSTRDPSRFTIAPLCLLAPVAAVQLTTWTRRLAPRSPHVFAVLVALWCGVFAQRGGKEAREAPPPPAPAVDPQLGTARLADPWSYALITGRPAVYDGSSGD